MQAIQAARTTRVENVPDPQVDVENEALLSVDVEFLWQLLRGLPPLEMRVLRWRYGLAGEEELSYSQIGEQLGVAKGTAWAIEARALDRLRVRFGRADLVDSAGASAAAEASPDRRAA